MSKSVNKSVPAMHLGEFSGWTGAFSWLRKIWNDVLKRAAGGGELVGEDVAAVAMQQRYTPTLSSIFEAGQNVTFATLIRAGKLTIFHAGESFTVQIFFSPQTE